MKPCIILWSELHQRYEAWNEDGMKITWHPEITMKGCYSLAGFLCYQIGYEVVPLNSRLARTILDKIDQRKAGQL